MKNATEKVVTFFELSSSTESFLRHLSATRVNYPAVCEMLLRQDIIMMMIFNNGQKGAHPFKFLHNQAQHATCYIKQFAWLDALTITLT